MLLNSEQQKQLSAEAAAYLGSSKGDDLSLLITRKYDLDGRQLQLFVSLLSRLYLKTVLLDNLPAAIVKLFGFDQTRARQMACDIAGARLLAAEPWFDNRVAELIIAWGGRPEKYDKHVAAARQALIKERTAAEAEAVAVAQETAAPVEDDDVEAPAEGSEAFWRWQAASLEQLLASQLGPTLALDDTWLVAEINQYLVYLLSDRGADYALKLTNLLLASEELLTPEQLLIDGRLLPATVGHWLRDFIAKKGSGSFDTISISDYVTNSENGRKLKIADRDKVAGLLAVFARLKFFPENQVSDDPADWQIFSAPWPPRSPAAESDEVTPPPTAEPNVAPLITVEPAALTIGPPTPPPVSDRQLAHVFALQKMLAEAKPGSLEYLAIEEELRKYQNHA